MKINWVLLIIAASLTGLGAFGFFQANAGSAYRALIASGSGISLLVTLLGLLALSSPNGGTLNIKIVSGIFFTLLLLEHIIFSAVGVRLTPYVIITGFLLLVYILIAYAISRALK